MSPLHPPKEDLRASFYSPYANANADKSRSPYLARTELYSAWSVVDDTKDKAQKLGNEASKEFEKASSKAQAKAGKIDLYSGKYYAACTFGGLMACVCIASFNFEGFKGQVILTVLSGSHSRGGHATGSR